MEWSVARDGAKDFPADLGCTGATDGDEESDPGTTPTALYLHAHEPTVSPGGTAYLVGQSFLDTSPPTNAVPAADPTGLAIRPDFYSKEPVELRGPATLEFYVQTSEFSIHVEVDLYDEEGGPWAPLASVDRYIALSPYQQAGLSPVILDLGTLNMPEALDITLLVRSGSTNFLFDAQDWPACLSVAGAPCGV